MDSILKSVLSVFVLLVGVASTGDETAEVTLYSRMILYVVGLHMLHDKLFPGCCFAANCAVPSLAVAAGRHGFDPGFE